MNYGISYSANKINFTSRNKEIRKADDIARVVNIVYPRVSSSNIGNFNNIDKYPDVHERYINKICELRKDVDNRTSKAYAYDCDLVDKIKIMPDLIKERKVGNCSEATCLAALAAKINGIDNLNVAILGSSETGVLDHAVLLVENKEKPYIIDSWLGFADYVPNTVNRYISEYGNRFDLSSDSFEKIDVYPIETVEISRINKASKEELAEAFPELVLGKKNKKTQESKIKQFFKKLLKKD